MGRNRIDTVTKSDLTKKKGRDGQKFASKVYGSNKKKRQSQGWKNSCKENRRETAQTGVFQPRRKKKNRRKANPLMAGARTLFRKGKKRDRT